MSVNRTISPKNEIFCLYHLQKQSFYYFKSFQLTAIDFLRANIYLSDVKAKFFYKT